MAPKPAKIEQYPCPGCGADMTYNPAKGQLNCSYCGYLETLSDDPQAAVEKAQQEHNLQDFLNLDQSQMATLSTHAQEAEMSGVSGFGYL